MSIISFLENIKTFDSNNAKKKKLTEDFSYERNVNFCGLF
jgi:hypothetical protein